jgi:hypothetical protein
MEVQEAWIIERNWKSSADKRGWSLERDRRIKKAECWKGTGRSSVDKRRPITGKELEDQL